MTSNFPIINFPLLIWEFCSYNFGIWHLTISHMRTNFPSMNFALPIWHNFPQLNFRYLRFDNLTYALFPAISIRFSSLKFERWRFLSSLNRIARWLQFRIIKWHFHMRICSYNFGIWIWQFSNEILHMRTNFPIWHLTIPNENSLL